MNGKQIADSSFHLASCSVTKRNIKMGSEAPFAANPTTCTVEVLQNISVNQNVRNIPKMEEQLQKS
jgi:hypothetical protein